MPAPAHPARPRRVLLVAVSARMLADLAVADGFDVVSLDRFGDADLRARCPGRSIARDLGGVGGMADLVALADDAGADAVVYGAGLEDRPDLVARLAAGRTLLGTSPDALAGVRDPGRLGTALRAAGVAVPDTWAPAGPDGALIPVAAARAAAPDPADGWLRKPRRGGGGRGVHRWAGGALRPTEVLQREVPGLPVSVVAIAHGPTAATPAHAEVLAVTEQLVGEPRLGGRGFAWCGNVAPPRLGRAARDALAEQLARAADVAAAAGVRGAFGVDAMWDGDRAWVIEVNPRPTAGLEVAALLGEPAVLARHVAACLGPSADVAPGGAGPPARRRRADGTGGHPRSAAKVVVYAREDVVAPSSDAWPGAVVDLPHPGEVVATGAPVCTVLGVGAHDGPGALVEGLVARAGRLPLRSREVARG